MPKIISLLMLSCCLFLLYCKNETKSVKKVTQQDELRQTAEFEPCESVWLLWSNYEHKQGFSNEKVSLNIINSLLTYSKVKLVFSSDSLFQAKKMLLPQAALESKQLETYIFPFQEFWARDMGPAFIIKNNKLAIADFNFNAWSYGDLKDSLTIKDEKLDERIAKHLNFPLISTDLITEGGNHEVNGKGTLILTESVESMRNPNKTLPEIEAEYKRILGIKKIIWLKKGLNEDDNTQTKVLTNAEGEKVYNPLTTNGHTDEFVRFVSPTTILLAMADSLAKDPISVENAKRLEENYQILKNTTDQDGKPFNIIRVPLPKHIFVEMKPKDAVYEIIKDFKYQDGTVFPNGKPIKVIAAASYLNFLIANDCVLTPKYYESTKDLSHKKTDEQAKNILKSVFPNKKIIQLDVLPVNIGGGGIHCITMNEPKILK